MGETEEAFGHLLWSWRNFDRFHVLDTKDYWPDYDPRFDILANLNSNQKRENFEKF